MTLTEVAVVLGIAGTLMAIAVPNYTQWKNDADLDAQIKETKSLLNGAQYECMTQGRHAQVSIGPTGVSVTTIPEEYDGGGTPTYTLLSAGVPTIPMPPPPTEPTTQTPVTKDRRARFPWDRYVAAYIDRRGQIYTLDEDSNRVDDAFAICARGKAVVFSPVVINYGHHDETKSCIPTEVTVQ